MTANFIALVCNSKLNQLRTDVTDIHECGLEQYNTACTLLVEYIRRHFLTFEMTDLVYTFAKDICQAKIKFENWYRRSGWMWGDRIKAYKEYGGNINVLQKKIVDGKFVL